jgi:hypothetical protein
MTHLSYFTGDKYRERMCRLITDQAESTPLLAITTTIRNGIGGYAETVCPVGVSRADWLTMRLAVLFSHSVYPRGPSTSVSIATVCFMPYSAANPLQVSIGSAIRVYSDFLDRHEDRQYLTHWRNAVAQLWQYAASYSSTSRVGNRPAININLSRF